MSKALKGGVRSQWPRTLALAMSIATATVLAGRFATLRTVDEALTAAT